MAETLKPEQKDDDLARLVQWFEASEESTQEERRLAERDRDYYDNKQLTREEEAELQKRGQPPIIVNRIKRKIDFLRGVETTQRSDPKAFPRTPQHEQDAEAATDSLRFVADANEFDAIASEVWENLLIEGAGGCDVRVGQKAGKLEIVLEHIPWDRLFWDPHSRKADFSDASYKGVVLWMDYDAALGRWKDGEAALKASMESVSIADTYDDRPRYTVWADPKRKRVRICQIWYRKQGKWHWCEYTKGGKLASGESPYLNEHGETEPGLILQSAYVDRENRRYGVVREMIGPQDEINKRRSKALHLLTLRQVVYEKGAVDDIRLAKQELAKPDGAVEVNPTLKFEIAPTGDMAQGHFELLQEAKAEIDMMGPNAAMQGKQGGDPSGRAIMAQQQGGYIELGPVMDRLRQWKIRVYRSMWNRVRQFWTEERWIRVTDDEDNVRFVGLNVPMQDPQTGQLVMHSPAQMDVDIIVEDAPDTVTIQHEQFQEMVGLAQAGIPIPPDVLIEASQLRNKKQLLEKMQGQGQPNPMQQQAMALEMEGKAADIDKKRADADKSRAQAHKTMVEAMPPVVVTDPVLTAAPASAGVSV